MSPANPLQDALDNPLAAPDFAQPGDVGPELSRLERPPFPPGCPVRPLGISSDEGGSQRCYYLNYNGQLTGLEAGNRHGKNSMIGLYGPKSDWLEEQWPQWSKPKKQYDSNLKEWVEVPGSSEITGFKQDDASRAHIEECVRQGIFDPAGRMRGRGAHRLTIGNAGGQGLVLHCGDKLLVSELKVDGGIKGWKWRDAGLLERNVYQAGEPIPRPWHEAAHCSAAERVLRELMTWNWRRRLLDARFVLGAIGLGPLGGALQWRPHIWVTGGRGTGKSTLNGKDGLVHRLLGEGVIRTSNTSSAFIRQRLRNATLPVMIDEREAGKDNRQSQELIELARISSSGDSAGRGGQDHHAQEFTLQSCFWFSSINIPPLDPQDRSRLAILELDPLPEDAPPPDWSKLNLPEIGRMLQRRMIDGWFRLAATKMKYHRALQKVGHDARACDQFGTLLAGADVLLHDWDTADGLPDDEEVNHWASLCRPQRMAEINDTTPDHQACVNHIVTSMVQARGGDEREALGTWIGRAVNHAVTPLLADPDAAERASQRLQQIGLKLVNARFHAEQRDGKGEVTRPSRWGAELFISSVPGYLAVAREHQALSNVFQNTNWQSTVWYQALKRVPGAIEGVKIKFGRASLTAVLVPLAAVLDEEELPRASQPAAASAWRDAQENGGGE